MYLHGLWGRQSIPCIKVSLMALARDSPTGPGRLARGPGATRPPQLAPGPGATLITGVLGARSVHFEPLVYTSGSEKTVLLKYIQMKCDTYF